MTEARREASEAAALREIIRRSGHEIRNALSGVAVNLEVVRSRCSRDAVSGEVVSFADRATSQVTTATTLTNGLLAIVNAALAGRAPTAAKSVKRADSVELSINPDASGVVSDIQHLTSAIGVSVEQRGSNVILRVLPEGRSHSKD